LEEPHENALFLQDVYDDEFVGHEINKHAMNLYIHNILNDEKGYFMIYLECYGWDVIITRMQENKTLGFIYDYIVFDLYDLEIVKKFLIKVIDYGYYIDIECMMSLIDSGFILDDGFYYDVEIIMCIYDKVRPLSPELMKVFAICGYANYFCINDKSIQEIREMDLDTEYMDLLSHMFDLFINTPITYVKHIRLVQKYLYGLEMLSSKRLINDIINYLIESNSHIYDFKIFKTCKYNYDIGYEIINIMK